MSKNAEGTTQMEQPAAAAPGPDLNAEASAESAGKAKLSARWEADGADLLIRIPGGLTALDPSTNPLRWSASSGKTAGNAVISVPDLNLAGVRFAAPLNLTVKPTDGMRAIDTATGELIGASEAQKRAAERKAAKVSGQSAARAVQSFNAPVATHPDGVRDVKLG